MMRMARIFDFNIRPRLCSESDIDSDLKSFVRIRMRMRIAEQRALTVDCGGLHSAKNCFQIING